MASHTVKHFSSNDLVLQSDSLLQGELWPLPTQRDLLSQVRGQFGTNHDSKHWSPIHYETYKLKWRVLHHGAQNTVTILSHASLRPCYISSNTYRVQSPVPSVIWYWYWKRRQARHLRPFQKLISWDRTAVDSRGSHCFNSQPSMHSYLGIPGSFSVLTPFLHAQRSSHQDVHTVKGTTWMCHLYI